MKKTVDQIFITNIPAFYKISLYNEIAKKQNIFVVFYDNACSTQNKDFHSGQMNFEYMNLGGLSKMSKIIAIFKILLAHNYKMLVVGGWDCILCWLSVLLSPKSKNAVVVESSCFESSTIGFKGFIKKFFMSRISTVYASGVQQEKLVRDLNFKKNVLITKGVGLFNVVKQPPYTPKNIIKKFLFVGRFVECKNLDFLIKVFNKRSDLELILVGFGDIDERLKSISKENIKFLGAVDNKKLPAIYRSSDVFVLPSLRDVWGLVVEEALNNGIPVLTSDNVGSNEALAKEGENGFHFSPTDEKSLENAIAKITDIETYNKLAFNISKYDFEKIKDDQVSKYIL